MRKLNASIVIFLIAVLWFDSTRAQDHSDAPSVLFGPQAGISKSPDADANVIFGAALRLRLLPMLGIEGSINYRQEELAGDALTVRTWPVQVTGMLYLLPVLYGSMGAGWYMTTLDFSPDFNSLDDTQSEFGWHFGGGLELPLGSVAKLTADLRYVFLNYNFDEFPGSSDIDNDFYMATAGLLFRL